MDPRRRSKPKPLADESARFLLPEPWEFQLAAEEAAELAQFAAAQSAAQTCFRNRFEL